MTQSLLQTKFYIPRPRPSLVNRPQLIERLDAGLGQGQIGIDAKLRLVASDRLLLALPLLAGQRLATTLPDQGRVESDAVGAAPLSAGQSSD